MTGEDIFKLAREAGAKPYTNRHYPNRTFHTFSPEQLNRFFALAADAEAKRMHTEGMVTVGLMREQIAAERKACAQLLRDNAAQCTKGSMNEYILTSNAQAIEARSQS